MASTSSDPTFAQVATAILNKAVTAGINGTPRPQQQRLTALCAQAIDDGKPLVVTAGTGCGKSLGYATPALAAAARLGRRVVIVTASKALQDQLIGKDIPIVRDVIATDVAVLKGRRAYVCPLKLTEAATAANAGEQTALFTDTPADEDNTPRATDLEADERDTIRRIATWAARTTTGDRAELDFEPDERTWSHVSISDGECLGKKCPRIDDCHIDRARKRAAEAPVVITNMHLWAADLAADGQSLLGYRDTIIFDEAHELPEVLHAALGASIGPPTIYGVAGAARAALRAPNDQNPTTPLITAAEQLATTLNGLDGQRIRSTTDGTLGETLIKISVALENLRDRVMASTAGATTARDRAVLRIDHARDTLNAILESDPHIAGNSVAWVEGDWLRTAPLSIAARCRAQVWNNVTPIFTSATIPSNLNRRLGLPDHTVTTDVGTPFNYPRQAILYVPANLPTPKQDGYEPAALDQAVELITAANGRALLLFTSHQQLNDTRNALADRIPHRLLVQGDAPDRLLIEAKRDDPTSVLMGTNRFWTGVDIPGDALRLVCIWRLPFPRPDEPFAQARREAADPRGFQEVDLPHAAMRLGQGVGRLIRTTTDTGVVAVFDTRLATAKYRNTIINRLPAMRRVRNPAVVTELLNTEQAA